MSLLLGNGSQLYRPKVRVMILHFYFIFTFDFSDSCVHENVCGSKDVFPSNWLKETVVDSFEKQRIILQSK